MFSRFFHAIACSSTSSLLTTEYYSIVGVYHTLSIHQLMDTSAVSHFWLLWIILLWTLVYKFLCGYRFSFLLSGSGTAGSCNSLFNILRNCYFPQQLHNFTFPPPMYKSSSFSVSSIILIISLFHFSHPSGLWSGISPWLWFTFPWWLMTLSIFSHAYWPFVHLLWRSVYSNFLSIS